MKKKMCQFLSIVVLIATAFCLRTENAFAASGDVWFKVFAKPYYVNSGDKDVLAMAAFGGTVYAGVARTYPDSANVYRLEHEGCKLWDCFTPPWAWDTGGYTMAMEVFNGHLYVGTDLGEIWRTDGLQWMNWENVTGNWGYGCPIADMAVFNVMGKGRLFALADGIRCTSDGVSWGEAVVLKDPKLFEINSLEVFDDHLYAGAGLKFGTIPNEEVGIQLWRTKNGEDWTKFKEIIDPAGYLQHVHALKVFGKYLYIGQYHNYYSEWLYRTNGKMWEVIDTKIVTPIGGVQRLEEHGNVLYLGGNLWAATPDDSEPLVYSSPDGTTWSAETDGPVFDEDTEAVYSLLSYGKKLYVGLGGDALVDGTMEIWALGPSAPACAFKVVGKSVDTAAGKIWGIVDRIYEHIPDLPDLSVLPPIGPRPPPPNGGEWPEWEFTLVRDMMSAVDGIVVPPELEETKELVIANLDLVDSEVGLAMSILYEATTNYDGEAFQILDQSDIIDEILSHLENALALCEEASSLLSLMYEEPDAVYVDIKPGSCPNPLNVKSPGLLPVAVLGTEDFGVTAIDPGSVRLSRDPVCCFVEPVRWSYEDVATPFEGESWDCHDIDGDGYLDLTLKFDTQELVSCLALESLVAGEPVPLTLTGTLTEEHGGTPIEGEDCIVILT